MMRFLGVIMGVSVFLSAQARVSDLDLRNHSQWSVSEKERTNLHDEFGIRHVSYSTDGARLPESMSVQQSQRWKAFYAQCLKDGCRFCDNYEGRCEDGTCGDNNQHCHLKVDRKGIPICHDECSYYAFKRISKSH